MKKKVISLLMLALIATSLFYGCGNTSADLPESTVAVATAAEAESAAIPEPTEAPHEHSYTEAIPATGHSFTNYVYNEDATYTTDGTETAKCDNCDETDTRTAEGTMLTYTFNDMSAAKYAKSTVNVRNLPDTDGEKVGSLSLNQEVAVTGQCNETGWYRIEYDGNTAYVSDSYLADNKIETQTESTSGTTASDASTTASDVGTTASDTSATASDASTTASSNRECPYDLYTVIDEGGDNVYFYCLWDGVNSVGLMPGYWETFNACIAILNERHGGNDTGCGAGSEETDYYVDGLRVVKQLPTSR